VTVSIATERTESTEKINLSLRALRVLSGKSVLALCALAAGALIATLPLRYSVALIVGGALFVAAFVEPLVGLAIMLLVGLTEPLLGATGLVPFSVGQATFALFVAGWIARSLAHRRLSIPQLPITIYFLLYLAACALSVFFTQPASPRDAATELLKWIEMLVIAAVVYDSAGRRQLGWALAILFGVGLFQAGVGLWQFQFRGHGPEAFKILGDHYRAYGTLEQPNPFGGFMGLVWPVAAALAMHTGIEMARPILETQTNADKTLMNADGIVSNQKNLRLSAFNLRNLRSLLLASATAALTLTALILSFSRGAWLGAGAASLAMLVFLPRRRWVGIALGVGGIAVIFTLYSFGLLPSFIASRFADVGDFVQVYDVRGVHVNDSNFSIVERLAHWQAALNMADASPLFGVGFGNYEAAYPDYRLAKWQYALGHAHMIYLNVLAETGVVGLAAYLILWGGIIGITIRVISRKDLTGFGNLSGLNADRPLALGLLGCWVHLATHQLLDNLYVGNIPLYLGALLGVLCMIAAQNNHQFSNL
jgi:O-antigen ligase